MIQQYDSEFDKPRRPGEVLVQWRNKQTYPGEKVERKWHKYKFMSESQATEFMNHCSSSSAFFEYRIFRKLDNNPES